MPRQGFISISWKLSILEHFKNCRFFIFFRCLVLCARKFGLKYLSYGFQILCTYTPRSEVAPRQSFISIGWKLSILEHFENCHPMLSTLCTRVWYEGIEPEIWNFIHVYTNVWSCASSKFHLDRLKIVDSGALWKLPIFVFVFQMPSTLCTRNWYEGIKLELFNFTHV